MFGQKKYIWFPAWDCHELRGIDVIGGSWLGAVPLEVARQGCYYEQRECEQNHLEQLFHFTNLRWQSKLTITHVAIHNYPPIPKHSIKYFARNVPNAVPRLALVIEDVLAVSIFIDKPCRAVSEFDACDCSRVHERASFRADAWHPHLKARSRMGKGDVYPGQRLARMKSLGRRPSLRQQDLIQEIFQLVGVGPALDEENAAVGAD